MNIFQCSKAEDAIDRYNHIWSVLFMLLLSLITWLIPLSPSLSTQLPQSSKTQLTIPVSRYTAKCWSPSEFSGSHIAYMNSICAKAFNDAVNGKDNVSGSGTGNAILYQIKDVKPARVSELKRYKADTKDDKPSDSTEDKVFRLRHLISIKTPLMLFVFAICLKLPHVVWTLLSGSSGINISQTLETAKEGQSLDKDSRHQLNQDLVLAVSQPAKSTSYSTAVLYLLFKVLMCIVVITEMIYVHSILLTEKETFENVIDLTVSLPKVEVPNFSDRPLLCAFSIQIFPKFQDFTVQCIFTVSEMPSKIPNKITEKKLPNVYMYKALFKSLMIYLFILFIINIINLLIWIIKLVANPCRQRLTPIDNLPLDVYLLLYMAEDNVGPIVVRDLSDGFA